MATRSPLVLGDNGLLQQLQAGDTMPAAAFGPVPALFFGGAGAVRMGQFRRALEASGAGRCFAVQSSVPADPGDAVNIAWTCEPFVAPGGVLATFVASAAVLNLSPVQMTAIFADAATQPN